eukprot:28412-Hanusia_phi.AAC.7
MHPPQIPSYTTSDPLNIIEFARNRTTTTLLTLSGYPVYQLPTHPSEFTSLTQIHQIHGCLEAGAWE